MPEINYPRLISRIKNRAREERTTPVHELISTHNEIINSEIPPLKLQLKGARGEEQRELHESIASKYRIADAIKTHLAKEMHYPYGQELDHIASAIGHEREARRIAGILEKKRRSGK